MIHYIINYSIIITNMLFYQTEFAVDKEQYTVRVPPELAGIGVLTEPLSVAEKAIDEIVRLQFERLPDAPAELDWLSGRPSGSAMPLVWAHAEYIKLIRSMRDGRVFDMPPQTVHRYIKTNMDSSLAIWRFNNKCRTMPEGKTLRVEVLSPANIHWSSDEWGTVHDADTKDTGLGLFVVDLPTASIPAGSAVSFTFCWSETDRWENRDFSVEVKQAV